MPITRKHQQGAVAILVGFALVVLVGMLALVIDLGHDYLVKTGLQNGADAAALAGALELDGTADGVEAAAQKAVEVARQNEYAFSNPVGTDAADGGLELSVGSCPEDTCMVPVADVTTDALAADKTFLKVDTGSRSMDSWFAGAFSILGAGTTQLSTFGMAVAGKYLTDVAPIAVCKLDDDPASVYDDELGYERGVSYRIGDFNPIGPGTIYWIDPESNTPGVCPATNTNDTLPYVCAGKVSYTPVVGETVNTNTGLSDPQLSALDSRFGDYPPAAGCNPATAPPDRNVKEYRFSAAPNTGSPSDWMLTNPTMQSIHPVDTATGGVCRQSDTCKPQPRASRTIADYGVLWSAYRPEDKLVSNWSDTDMYKEAAALYPPPLDSYPGSSPYAQTASSSAPYDNYFQAPPVAYRPGRSNRRVLNMVIVQCETSGGVCRPATVLGVGKFFMQRRANVAGDKDIYVEFGGLLPTPFPPTEIRLYR